MITLKYSQWNEIKCDKWESINDIVGNLKLWYYLCHLWGDNGMVCGNALLREKCATFYWKLHLHNNRYLNGINRFELKFNCNLIVFYLTIKQKMQQFICAWILFLWKDEPNHNMPTKYWRFWQNWPFFDKFIWYVIFEVLSTPREKNRIVNKASYMKSALIHYFN